MNIKITSTIVCLIFLPFLASAIPAPAPLFPRIPSNVPSGTSYIAYDESAHILHAFNSTGANIGQLAPAIETRASTTGTCTALSTDDLKKLPGFSKLEAQAKTNWGSGSYNLATNPSDQTGSPANLCVSTAPVQVKQSQSPSCTTTQQTTQGENVGTSGNVSLSASEGTSFSTTATVTNQASIGTGFSASAEVGIPDIANASASISTSMTFTNTQSFSTQATTNNEQTQTITINSDAGKVCKLSYQVTACTIHGTGTIEYLATGWTWFNYNSKTQGHYKWALSIDNTLSEADRSSTMGFSTVTNANTKSNYANTCT